VNSYTTPGSRSATMVELVTLKVVEEMKAPNGIATVRLYCVVPGLIFHVKMTDVLSYLSPTSDETAV